MPSRLYIISFDQSKPLFRSVAMLLKASIYLRMVTGIVQSFIHFCRLDWAAPDYFTISFI